MTTARICEIEPFRYQSVPQTTGDAGASSNQINEQGLEDYLSRMRVALCDDIQALVDTPPSGVDTFLELEDTPDSYVDDAGKAVVVNAAETALEYFPSTFVAQAGKMVVVANTEDGFALQTQPTPPSYFISPRLCMLLGPSLLSFGVAADVAVTGALVIMVASPANALVATHRFGFTAAAALNSNALCRLQTFVCIRGTAAPMGGFKMIWRFGKDTGTVGAGAKAFVGLYNSIIAQPFIAGQPSAIVNTIFMGFDNGDANWQIMHNDAAGTCNKIDLTATFAINNTDMYEFVLTAAPSDSSVDYRVRNLSTGDEASGNISTELPAGGVMLAPAMQIGSSASGAIQRLCHIFRSIEVGPGD